MSNLTYTTYEGYGERAQKNLAHSQAVRVGDVIMTSGQGGWDRATDKVEGDISTQIAKAFGNVEVALKNAGSRGWEDVFSLRSYHLPCNGTALGAMVTNLKKYCPNHQPIWTTLGVPELGLPGMTVEMEVQAYVPKE